MKRLTSYLFFFVLLFTPKYLLAQNVLESIIQADTFLNRIATQAPYQVQIIYTQINRNGKNKPKFKQFTFGLDPDLYFYPASTVKMPAALLALEKVNNLSQKGLFPEATMHTLAARVPQTAVEKDESAQYKKPSISHYIKKIFLVSDNDAYNRLYEFLGQEYINRKLYEKGYRKSRILHRLSASQFDVEDNKYTNPVKFMNGVGNVIHEQDEVFSESPYKLKLNNQIRGKGFINRAGKLEKKAFDFTTKNYMALQDLNDILKAVIFPDAVPTKNKFNLRPVDYKFLYRYMSMLPYESDFPAYDRDQYYDGYVKFFLFGDTKDPIPENFRIFNKVGDAYGFLTDIAYVVDFENGVEFLLSANIHVNKNEIFNDGVYEYDQIGFPFLAQLGRAIYQYEKQREKKVPPSFDRFK